MPRKPFLPMVQATVLVQSRRRCALCLCLNNDTGEKVGQLAHIDRNPENNNKENAAFLCLEHHSRYDSTSSQTKGYLPDELREYQRIVWAFVESLEVAADKPQPASGLTSRLGEGLGVSLEVYDRRLPMYHTAMEFVRAVLKDLKPEIKQILEFAADTDQALFLFDQNIAEYLNCLFNRALRLHTLVLLRTRIINDETSVEEDFADLSREETDLAVWFSEQHGEIRARFAPFLRLA
jgi:hypothetical protein